MGLIFLPGMIFYLAVSLTKSDKRHTFPWALSCFVPSLTMLKYEFNTTNLIFKLAFRGVVGCRVGEGFSLGPFWRPFAEEQAAFVSSQNCWDPTTSSAMSLGGPSCAVRPAGLRTSPASHLLLSHSHALTNMAPGTRICKSCGRAHLLCCFCVNPPSSYLLLSIKANTMSRNCFYISSCCSL